MAKWRNKGMYVMTHVENVSVAHLLWRNRRGGGISGTDALRRPIEMRRWQK